MIKSNWHTHTARCGHAVGTDEEYVVKAIEAGIKRLGFSDHAPYPGVHQEGHRMNYENLEDYVDSINNLKEKYKDQIEIYIGLEVEYLEDYLDILKEYRKRFDYLIIGQHTFEFHPTQIEDAYYITEKEGLLKYCEFIEKGCELGLVDCIAHPDVCLKSYPQIDDTARLVAERLADISLKYKIPLEANCGSGVKREKKIYKDGERYAYPTKAFFEIFAKKNCEVIYGLDIHNPEFFGTDIYLDRVKDILKESGCKAIDEYDMIEAARKRKEEFGYL